MRNHGTVRPSFWTGQTGKKLRKYPDAQRVAMYLMTGPHVEMTGIYTLPLLYICHEVGLSEEQVAGALELLADEDFAHYDADRDLVWVPNLAREQVGETCSAKDNKQKAIAKQLRAHRGHEFVTAFLDLYAESYHLDPTGFIKPLGSPLEAPSEGEERGSASPYAPAPVLVPDPVPSTAQLLEREHERRYAEKRSMPPTKNRAYREQLAAAAVWVEAQAQGSDTPVADVVARLLDGLFASSNERVRGDWGMRFLATDCAEFYAPKTTARPRREFAKVRP